VEPFTIPHRRQVRFLGPAWLAALLALSGCYASHRTGASAEDGPADGSVDAGPDVDPSGNHPCFDLGERACNRYPPNDDSPGCILISGPRPDFPLVLSTKTRRVAAETSSTHNCERRPGNRRRFR